MAAVITRSSTPRLLPERCVELQWSDGTTSRYHYVWLRQLHFHPATGRPDQTPDAGFRLPDEPESLVAEKCWVENGDLVVTWSNDGAETRHSLDWLEWHAYDEEHRRQRKAELVTWTGVQASRFTSHSWDEVMNDDESLWALFATLRDHGLVRLVGAPVEEGAIARLATRFGPLRVTDYGAISDIRSIPRAAGRYANIGASGHHRLGPHTDEGWRYAQPGIAFHLCLEQAPGGTGAALLIDGLLAAERLREHDREAFDLLTRIPFRFAAARNPEERYFARGRLIVTDQDGDIAGCVFPTEPSGSRICRLILSSPPTGHYVLLPKSCMPTIWCTGTRLPPVRCTCSITTGSCTRENPSTPSWVLAGFRAAQWTGKSSTIACVNWPRV